ncbi:protein of unknown function [Psychrobacillus sp. OK028]|uniref:DUF4362 domain-containing protein n=1 Tax=Psychrobacillus sp. OK028 TaxID=1884359 RepID=UPI00088889AC|nr:DUF4362 domain-containing protein [Psychrobacillus sp. OK028]SDN15998.1 protein of unknown function [Psychrobacillus sp. OK028]
MRKLLCLLLFLGTCMLSACSYDSETAAKNGDVINMNGPVYNFHRFERFLDNIEAKEAAYVRIANYTPEGNPTLYNLSFDGSVFNLEIDLSKNKDLGDSPAKVNMTCSELISEEGQQLFTYTLEGCQQDSTVESFTILSIMKEQVEDHEH